MKPRIIFAFLVFVAGSELSAQSGKTIETARPANAPFRLIFNSYDGDPEKEKPEKFSFQINALDIKQPTEFRRLGETIPNTKLRLTTFTYKTARDAQTGDMHDISELTLVNRETGKSVVLVLTKVMDVSAANAPAQQLQPK